jgi:hypothetical protein
VISFGFFDGTPEQLREVAAAEGYGQQLERIAPFVESVGADGLYEIVEEFTAWRTGRLPPVQKATLEGGP